MKTEDQQADCRSLTSVDSGLGGNQSESPPSATKDQDPSRAKTKDAGDGQTKDGESYTETRSKTQPQSVSEMFGCTEEEVMRELTGFNAVPLEKLDNHTGVLHVWLLVLEGMASTVSTCPKNYQPQTLEMLFDLLRSAAQTPGELNRSVDVFPPGNSRLQEWYVSDCVKSAVKHSDQRKPLGLPSGPEFGMHCVNHLLLPMLQSWLRRGNQITGYWDTSTANFKQCAGFCTDLVVEYTVQFASELFDYDLAKLIRKRCCVMETIEYCVLEMSYIADVSECQRNVEFMLKQMFDVMTECIAQSSEAISRLGCSCIKYVRFWPEGVLFSIRKLRFSTVTCLFSGTAYSARGSY